MNHFQILNEAKPPKTKLYFQTLRRFGQSFFLENFEREKFVASNWQDTFVEATQVEAEQHRCSGAVKRFTTGAVSQIATISLKTNYGTKIFTIHSPLNLFPLPPPPSLSFTPMHTCVQQQFKYFEFLSCYQSI